MKNSFKIGLVSLGCPKNLVDSEIILGSLNEKGFEITPFHELADVIVINTCAFISDAKEEAIISILDVARYKTQGNLKYLIVAGCLAERYKEEVFKEMPEVDVVVGTGSIDQITGIISRLLSGEAEKERNKVYANKPDSVDYLELSRLMSDDKPYAYLKIAEGCSNCCTYCIIPSIRGDFRSRTIENITKEARLLAQNGRKEIILVAQDVTRYGTDIYGERKLVSLIRELSAIDEIERIRLLYCYPELIDHELIKEIKENLKLCKYLDIPLQHISDKMLKAMGRRGNKQYIYELLDKIKEEIPEIVLRTSFIVGFPGETLDDFQELFDFVKVGYFEHVGVFTYSREEGTPAYSYKTQLPEKIKNIRREKLMELQQKNVEKYNNSRIGLIYDTIVEGVADDGIFYEGRTCSEAPEIDPVIYFTSSEPLENGMIVPVKILCSSGYDLVGEVVFPGSDVD